MSKIKVSDLPAALQTAAKSVSRRKTAIVSRASFVSLGTGWSGGSRSQYYRVDLATGRTGWLPGNSESEWVGSRKETPEYAILPGTAVLDCGTSSGKPAYPAFWLCSEDFDRLFPRTMAPKEVSS